MSGLSSGSATQGRCRVDASTPIEARARALLGARFRPHGRDPASGLDCVGLAALVFGVAVPSGYALRSSDRTRLVAAIAGAGLVPAARSAPGDLLLFETPSGLHLAIRSGAGIVHACATLRRVVERPGPLPWPLIGAWRLET